MTLYRPLLVAALAGLAACAPPRPGTEEAATTGTPLLASVQASTYGSDSVRFTLQVTNTTASPLQLEFSSGQEYDFVVTRGTQEVWRWSGDRMFTQALRTTTVGPGETLQREATWVPVTGTRGEHTVRGTITARNVPVEAAVPFRLE